MIKAHPDALLAAEREPDRLAEVYQEHMRDVYGRVYHSTAGGRIGTEGANKGMRYSAIGAVSPDLAAPVDDGDDDGAPAEVVP